MTTFTMCIHLQIERAHKVLRLIRGKRWDVTKELTDLKVATEGREKHHVAVRDFVASSVLKPFLMALTLMFFFQVLSGGFTSCYCGTVPIG